MMRALIILCAVAQLRSVRAAPVTVNNSAPRQTADGEIVDSHNGGLILAFGSRYLLYGISFGGCTEQPEGCTNSTSGACGFGNNATISVYSSPSLEQSSWKLERADVLPIPAGQMRGTVSRPSLVHCPSSDRWLLFWNYATVPNEGQWALAVASAADPLGPFTLLAAPISMPHTFVGDFTVFYDEADGSAWLFYTTWSLGGQLFLARLDTATFARLADPLELHGPLFDGLSLMESPLLWRRPGPGGSYYFATGHGCCFCAEGSGVYIFSAPAVRGPYRSHGNIGCNYSQPAPRVSVDSQGCLSMGICYTSTLQAELAYTFSVGAGVNETRVLVFDRWQHAPDHLKSHDPEYWLPVQYGPDGGLLPLRRVEAWTLDVPAPPP